ncbi:uncharacterized protein [Primulina eburnea]|uniref:uncharacterized protein isoform X2 n=1 Tax=Primulina eburnea TaxID=1245227 RepID=UPI003C6CA2EB
MSPNVQINVIRMLEKMKQKRVKDKDFSEFTSQLDGSTLSKLSELNKEVLERCKHIIFPISYRAHWILLGYTRGDQYFTLRDSLNGPVYKGAAKKIAKFMSGYLWNVKNCDVGKEITRHFGMKNGILQWKDIELGLLWRFCLMNEACSKV